MVSGLNKYISLAMLCFVHLPQTRARGGEPVSQPTVLAPSHTAAEIIRLSDLLSEALQKNAGLRAVSEDTKVKDAAIGPAGAYENPTFGAEAMNFPVNSFSRSEFGMTGLQLSLSQKVPFPGKLSKLKSAAGHSRDASMAAGEQKKFELIRDVKKAFLELVLSFRKKEILEDQKKLVTQVLIVCPQGPGQAMGRTEDYDGPVVDIKPSRY